MSRIFISYHRRSQAVATGLAQDLEAMCHTVWFDQDLSGGQSWWNRILAMIRDTDVFVFPFWRVINPAATFTSVTYRSKDSEVTSSLSMTSPMDRPYLLAGQFL